MTMTATLRPARPEDLAAVQALLRDAGLPHADVDADRLADVIVADEAGAITACAGMERHGEGGLLRSVAVRADRRGTGLGTALVRRALVRSMTRGDAALRLATTDAAAFFARLGFVPEPSPPEALRGALFHHGACPASTTTMVRPAPPPVRVLVLCTGNSARSQLGEALLAVHGGAMLVAASAGSKPAARVNPMAVRVLAEHGIAWDGGTPKTIDSVADQGWDLVLTVCDNAKEACPILPGVPLMVHWGMPDPADLEPESARHAAFEAVYAGLLPAVTALLDLLAGGAATREAVAAIAPRVTFD